jgi:proteasome lid subunit RPN8/RPN11
MKDNINIELQNATQKGTASAQLPVNFLTVGEIENDDVKVYIKQDVYNALEKYASEDTEHERGTVILGDYREEMGKTHVVISNYIEAKYTDASSSTLTFTHESWDYIHKEHDSKYPDKKIVGWQHTHPNYGIFLSSYDLFIHENFFNMPFQVAYVIDPIQNLRGFFQWKNGKIEKLKGYYVYDDIGKQIKIEQVKSKNAAKTAAANKSGWH